MLTLHSCNFSLLNVLSFIFLVHRVGRIITPPQTAIEIKYDNKCKTLGSVPAPTKHLINRKRFNNELCILNLCKFWLEIPKQGRNCFTTTWISQSKVKIRPICGQNTLWCFTMSKNLMDKYLNKSLVPNGRHGFSQKETRHMLPKY